MPDVPAIRCIIIDDEPPARNVLKNYIEAIPSLQLCGECGNAIDALNLISQQPVDLLFLDIHMPQLKGNDLLKIISPAPKVIITTAYVEYALEGYEFNVVDYLLKPIKFERFLKAVVKTFPLVKPVDETIAIQKEEQKQEQYIYVRADRKMVKVLLQDIFYIEGMKDYVKLWTRNGVVITKQSITSMEAMLPEDSFIRTHRSFIVSIDKIKSYTHEVLEIEKTEIPIGKLFRNSVLKVLE